MAKGKLQCRSCGFTRLERVISFDPTPLADRLLMEDQLEEPELTAPFIINISATSR